MPKEFFIWKNEKPNGPHTLAQLQAMLQTWQVTPETLVCEKGGNDWVPLGPFLEFVGTSRHKGKKALGALLVVAGLVYGGWFLIMETDDNLGRILRENVESTARELSDRNSALHKRISQGTAELAVSDGVRGLSPSEQSRRTRELRREIEGHVQAQLSEAREKLANYESERMTGRILHGGIAGALIIGGVVTQVAARRKGAVAPVTAPPPPSARKQPAKQTAPLPPKAPSRPAAPQMMLKDVCPACSQHVEYPSEASGQAVPCPSCKQQMTLA